MESKKNSSDMPAMDHKRHSEGGPDCCGVEPHGRTTVEYLESDQHSSFADSLKE